jgi:hypothetical protein
MEKRVEFFEEVTPVTRQLPSKNSTRFLNLPWPLLANTKKAFMV